MSDTTKKGVFEEFTEEMRKRGGATGIAQQELSDELKKAEVEKDHPLRKVVEARWNNKPMEADRLLEAALLDNTSDSLGMASLFLVKLPRRQALIKQAALYTREGNDEALKKMPLRLIQAAAMTVAIEEEAAVKKKYSTKGGDEKKRKDTDGKQKAKAFIKECWLRWQLNPDSYRSAAAFASDMLEKQGILKNQNVIVRWCKTWKEELPC
ncbi:MAG: hypothetical protein WC627_12855 [Legionella sp.]|jgi:hypothetical protein